MPSYRKRKDGSGKVYPITTSRRGASSPLPDPSDSDLIGDDNQAEESAEMTFAKAIETKDQARKTVKALKKEAEAE